MGCGRFIYLRILSKFCFNFYQAMLLSNVVEYHDMSQRGITRASVTGARPN
jgi:hypothetical protein